MTSRWNPASGQRSRPRGTAKPTELTRRTNHKHLVAEDEPACAGCPTDVLDLYQF